MLGTRIQQARLAMGFNNQAEFCRRVGVQAETLYRWERGRVAPDAFNLYEVARLLNVSMEWLVAGEKRAENPALAEWLDSPKGRAASPDARAFLASLPIGGYRTAPLFYDLALVAYEAGLSREETVRAAAQTARRR
jgi:transcriptional regulator with XRE-family HTH domain